MDQPIVRLLGSLWLICFPVLLQAQEAESDTRWTSHLAVYSLQRAVAQPEKTEVLNLRSQDLAELSPDVGRLVHTRFVNLMKNNLQQLPVSLGLCTALEVLLLGGNPLTALPNELGDLPKLQTLDARKCKLSSLPAGMPALQHLYLSYNSFAQWPDLPASLQHLLLDNNALTALPAHMQLCSQLQQLDVSFNKLKTIEEGALALPQLSYLNLSNNTELTTLPTELGRSCTRLEVLNIAHTGIQRLPASMQHMPELRIVIASGTQLQELPAQLQWPRLEVLMLVGCPLSAAEQQRLRSLFPQADIRY